jgi:hypothetical protein
VLGIHKTNITSHLYHWNNERKRKGEWTEIIFKDIIKENFLKTNKNINLKAKKFKPITSQAEFRKPRWAPVSLDTQKAEIRITV